MRQTHSFVHVSMDSDEHPTPVEIENVSGVRDIPLSREANSRDIWETTSLGLFVPWSILIVSITGFYQLDSPQILAISISSAKNPVTVRCEICALICFDADKISHTLNGKHLPIFPFGNKQDSLSLSDIAPEI